MRRTFYTGDQCTNLFKLLRSADLDNIGLALGMISNCHVWVPRVFYPEFKTAINHAKFTSTVISARRMDEWMDIRTKISQIQNSYGFPRQERDIPL